MKSNVLTVQNENSVCTIMLSRPDKLNSFNKELRADLLLAVKEAEKDPAARVIVFKGDGKGFCAGADLGEGVEDNVEHQLKEEYKPFLMAIHDCPKPCIAQVHGTAAGIGAALAMVCDLVIMSDDAYVYLAFAAIGLIPDGGLNWHLYHSLGPRKAYEIIVEGKRLSAEECLKHGICNQVVQGNQLDESVSNRAANLATGAPLAQTAAKKLLRQMGETSLSDAINLEAEIQLPLSQSADCKNAVAAFFRKEKPIFEGK